VCFSTPSRAVVALAVTLATALPLIGCSANKPAQPQATDAQGASSPATTQPATPAPAPTNVARKQKNAELNKWLADVDVAVPPTTYRVDPPDVIKITAPAIKELDQTTARIRTDGKIGLNLIGDVYVAGMSPSEIAEEITSRLGKFYNKDTVFVSVEVTEFASKKYYVFGQVSRPGVKSYTGRDTVIKVLAEAALNDDAWPQKVVLIRPNEDQNVRQKVTVDLKQMYTDGKTDQNFLLEEGDLVYVPPSPLAEFRIQFTKLITPIIPVTDFALMAFTGF
jgi:polysaccharide export outer membrane protein